MKACQLLHFYLLSFFRVSICLVVSVSVPSVRQRGDSVSLLCDYELERDERLYSVKWYRDNEEFYRYMPRLRPPQHSFRVDGVNVNMEKSTARRVQLQSVTLRSRGSYRCEVSAEAPSFHSAQAESYMEVYFLPKENPIITGHERRYSIGEPLDVNCTSARAYPAPQLDWYIDDYKVRESSWLARHGWWRASHGLVVAGLGLRAPASRRMRLRCVATLAEHARDHTVLLEASKAERARLERTLQTMLILLACSNFYPLLYKISHKIT